MYCYTCEKESLANRDNNPQQPGQSFIFAIEDIAKHDLRHTFESLQGFYEGKLRADLDLRSH